jgi:fluoroacetyl-CoA thioesterase
MAPELAPGLESTFTFKIPETKTIAHLFPEATEFQQMPAVLATGFMVGLIEWACIEAIKPYIDWPREQSVGIHVDFSHLAATPPGLTVTVKTRLLKVEGRKLTFSIVAHDGVDTISEGTHQRFIIDADKFSARVADKARRALSS